MRIDYNRRLGDDRRRKAGINVRLLVGNGKRSTIRRREDRNRYFFVDRYNPRFFLYISTILILSVLDAWLTLFLINHGAYETNPLMAYCLKADPSAFFTVKYALTSMGVLILLMLRNIRFRKVRVHSLFYCAIGAFMAVVIWEFYLIFFYVVV